MRSFESSHPWLTEFSLDLRKISYETWLLLGEAASKVEHIAGVPLNPEAAARLHRIYLIRGALATTAIEGNTLTEEEVRQYLDKQSVLPPSRQYLGQEIDNIIAACNRIGTTVIKQDVAPITVREIEEYNRLVLRDLPLGDDVSPGEFRHHSVVVGRYRAVPAEDAAFLLEKFCHWLNSIDAPKGLEQPYAILTAIAAHIYFVWIHPFADGNGRTARLIEFRYLLDAGFPTPAAHLLSNFYNLTRSQYYQQLDRASRSHGQMTDFIAYAVRGLVDQLKEQLQDIRLLQWDVTWRNYVHERFSGMNSKSDARRKRLVLELSKINDREGGVNVSQLSQLTPKLAADYASKTPKTLSRDLNAVIEMGLVLRQAQKVKANKGLILAFLPARARRPIAGSGNS